MRREEGGMEQGQGGGGGRRVERGRGWREGVWVEGG